MIISLVCLAGAAAVTVFLFRAKEAGTFRRSDVPERFRSLWLFWRAGDLLAERVSRLRRRMHAAGHGKYERICAELYVSEPGADTLRRLEAGRYGIALLTLLMALLLGLVAGLAGRERTEVTSLRRNAAGGGSTAYDLQVRGLAEEEVPLTVIVEEQRYADTGELFEAAYAEAREKLFAPGDDADAVRQDLNFSTRLCGGLVRASWESGTPELVSYDGTLNTEGLTEEGALAELFLTLRYEEEEQTYAFSVRVCPPILSEEEAQVQALAEEIAERESAGRESDRVELPSEVDGHAVAYVPVQDGTSPLQVVMIGIIGALLWFFLSFRKLEDRARDRTEQMRGDYPEVILKLAILLRAGLTVRGAWERIVQGYRARRTAEKRYIYEEMQQTVIRIMGGRPETDAYLEFGRRTHLHCYLKLSSLLEQNLRKGGKNLVRLLETESDKAWHERRNTALKKGEEAGTKLVLPMMLNMVVVMMVIMIPAMLSFY